MTKNPSGKYRICGDYRLLNNKTLEDRYPIPHIQYFTSNSHGKTIFSKMDLAKGYHQIPLSQEDPHKSAVITPLGLFEYIKMPFVLRNAAQTFQRVMDNNFMELDFVFVYLDDLLIARRRRTFNAYTTGMHKVTTTW